LSARPPRGRGIAGVLLAGALAACGRPGLEPLAAARAALGTFPPGGIELRGHAEFQGTRATFRWQLAADGRFRREIVGPVHKVSGFDGTCFWQMDDSGVPYELRFFAREYARIESALVSGLWCAPGAPYECSAAGDGRIAMRAADGPLVGEVLLDPGRSVPRAWRVADRDGDTGLDLEDWQEALGHLVARTISAPTAAGQTTRYVVEEVRPLDGGGDFARPPRTPRGFRLDPEAAAEVELHRSESGHLFVRPRLGGEEAGWFVLDTGAALSVIASEEAERLGMPVLGSSTLVGAGEAVHQTRLREGRDLELGPLTIERIVWSEPPAGAWLEELGQGVEGRTVAGVVGFDLFVRCLVELDLVGGHLALRDPETYRLPPEGRWEPLLLHKKHPFVRGRYPPDREGWFCVDSGAGAMTLTFHVPTVLEERLLVGRVTREVEALGAGGAFRLAAAEIDWFEVAGRRHEHPRVYFSRSASGALSDAWTAGTLGQPFFEGQTLVFDYAGGRVGVIPAR